MSRHCIVSIIDRNEIAREGLRRIIADRGFKAVETRPDAEALSHDPDHLIVITCASSLEALHHCHTARSLHPGSRIVIVVDDCCSELVVEALAAGADGVLSKLITLDPLVAALHLIALGEKVIPTSVVEDLPVMPRPARVAPAEQTELSAREFAVLDRIAAGRANKLISRDLGIAEGTVKVHVKSILRKLGLSNRTQAALWAAERAAAPPMMPPAMIPGAPRPWPGSA